MVGRAAPYRICYTLLFIVNAGCFSTPTESISDSSAPTLTITAPGTFSDAFNDANRSHVHDYWNGRKSVTLFNETFTLSSLRSENGRPDYRTRPSFEIPLADGHTVYPGTKFVNISVRWTFSDRFEKNLELIWMAADGRSKGILPVAPIAELSIITNESMNDLPHSQTSRWDFAFHGSGKLLEVFGGPMEVHARIQIIRDDGPLVAAPPHPDRWQGVSRLTVFRTEGQLWDVNGYTGYPLRADGSPPLVVSSRNGLRSFPFDTSVVIIQLFYNSSTAPEVHYFPIVSWHGANTSHSWTDTRPSKTNIDRVNGALEWRLSVTAEMWDSPYLNESLWEFRFSWDEYSGRGTKLHWMDGDFHFEIEATRSAR